MAAIAEARAHDAVGNGLADQEFLERAALLVEEVDRAVVGRLETVDLAPLAAEIERGVEQFRPLGGVGPGLLVVGVEQVDPVARRDATLEVDVVAEDPDDILDRGAGHVVARTGLVEALVEPGAAALVLLVLAVGGVGLGLFPAAAPRLVDRRRDGNEASAVVDRRDGLHAALAEEHHPRDLPAVAGPGPGGDLHPELLPFR